MAFHTTVLSRFSSLFLIMLLLRMPSRIEGDVDVCLGKDRMRMFDSSREICCGGTTHSKSKFICCNGKPAEKKVCSSDGPHCEEQICCEKELVNARNHLCCNDNLIKLNDTEVILRNELRCCGKGYYMNGDLKFCCGESTVQLNSRIGCCGGEIYDRVNTKKKCVSNKIVLPFQGVCNGDVYDKTESSCCGVKLNTKIPELLREQNRLTQNPAFDCCGAEVMDPQKRKCCPMNVYRFPSHTIPKDTHLQCCGHGYFDTTKELCINDAAVPKGKYGEQCGSHLINSSTQGCCDNKLPFHKETEKCCKGSHHCILPKDGKCCNGYPLRENEVCCQGFRPCRKGDKDDDQCCYNLLTRRGQTYKSSNNQKCRRGKLVKTIVNQYPCGPSASYTASHEICCINKIYQRKEGYVRCCGDKGLKHNEQCCKVLEKTQNFGNEVRREILTPCVKARCGSHSINTATDSCCGGRFSYKSSSKRTKCCSDRELYDKRYSKCTEDGRVEPLTSHKSFCRSSLFDGAIEEACVRNYGIVGKVTKIEAQSFKYFTNLTIYLRRVKPLHRQIDLSPLKTPRSLVLVIQTKLMKEMLCLNLFEKKSRKFMIFFDEPVRGNQVQIFEQDPFFITRYTRRRYKDVTNEITKEFCAHYHKFSS